MQKVVFDSSFLIAVAEHPTTWFEDIRELVGSFEPVLLRSVGVELGRLSSGSGKRARLASLAGDMVETKGFTREAFGGSKPDDDIVSFATKERAAVATIDGALIGQLRALKVSVISLRMGRAALA